MLRACRNKPRPRSSSEGDCAATSLAATTAANNEATTVSRGARLEMKPKRNLLGRSVYHYGTLDGLAKVPLPELTAKLRRRAALFTFRFRHESRVRIKMFVAHRRNDSPRR